MIILPNFYFAPISYFSIGKTLGNIYLEKWENFPKQTYRNRCVILGANGKLSLTIPIKHSGDRIFKDIKISYDTNWQKIHWKSIQSGYQSSPYFEYYEHELVQFFEKKEKFLFDFNLIILEYINKKLKLNLSWEFTEKYMGDVEGEDYRDFFNAKKENNFKNKEYIQVFSDRFQFMSDLSILDLLCNIGPNSAEYLSNNH